MNTIRAIQHVIDYDAEDLTLRARDQELILKQQDFGAALQAFRFAALAGLTAEELRRAVEMIAEGDRRLK